MANNSVQFNIKLNVDGKDRIVQATTSVDNLRSVIDSTKDATQRLNESFVNAAQCAQLWQNLSSGVQALSGTLNQLTQESRSFGGAMTAANTMAGKSGEELANLKEQVTELSKTLPVARDELANGLYQVISNGVPEDNWLSFLGQSAKASVGGIADLGEVVKVTSTIIKNYGLEWSDAQAIQDKIQLTAKNGVTTFEEMAQALPRVAANAANLGVSVDDLMASFATLTSVSGDTAEVSTQLAAIFTALIKPSSEATEMAQQMGIEFNAASIKASGGFTQFLTRLDQQVSQFAKSSGMLKEEIYGKLFGSAESLRAITPLTGNLAKKFEQNSQQMQDSAGTIEDAFSTMAGTASARLQMMNNQIGEFTDAVQTRIGNLLPVLNIGSQLAVTAASVMSLKTSLRGLTAAIESVTGVGKLWRATAESVNAICKVCSATMRGAAVSATTLKVAIRGLMVATGVGVVITVLTTVIEKLMDKEDEAATKTEGLGEAEQAYQSTAAQTKVAMDGEIQKLQDLIKAKDDTTQAVKHLNDTYGTVFGNHETAAEWYDTLTKKSQVYARQLGYEAQMKVLSTKLAEKQIQLQDNYDKRRNLWKSGGAKQTTTRVVGTGSSGATMTATYKEDTQAYKDLKDEARGLLPEIGALQKQVDIAQRKMSECSVQIRGLDSTSKGYNKTVKVSQMNLSQVKKAIEQTEAKLGQTTNKAQIAKLREYERQLQARKKALEKETGIGSYTKAGSKPGKEPEFYKDPKTLDQLDKNINYYQGKITSNNTAEDQRLRRQIQLWKEKKAAIELANKEAERPLKLDSEDAYNKDIGILQSMVSASTDESQTKKLQAELEGRQRELGMFKIKMGIETVPKIEIKKESRNIFEQIKDQEKDFLAKLKPIKIRLESDIKREDLEAIRSLGHVDLRNFDNVQQTLGNICKITSPTAKGLAVAGESCEALGGAMQQLGANSAAAKAGLIMAALGQLALSFAQAMTSASSNWITWLAFGISGTAQLISMVSTISAFATGGIVGGNQKSGDNVLVRVNSGEMILNAAQQARLFALANGAAVYGATARIGNDFAKGVALPGVTVSTDRLQSIIGDGGNGGPQSITLRLRGSDLVGAIANETRSNRKRSNIRIG